jgi:hypothetical protein
MRHDVVEVWDPLQKDLFMKQAEIEKEALDLFESGKKLKAIEFLTDYTIDWGEKVVKKAWELGDLLWTRYDEKF